METQTWFKEHEAWLGWLTILGGLAMSAWATISWIIGKNNQLNENTKRIHALEEREQPTPGAAQWLEKLEKSQEEHLTEGHPLCKFHESQITTLSNNLSEKIEALHADFRAYVLARNGGK